MRKRFKHKKVKKVIRKKKKEIKVAPADLKIEKIIAKIKDPESRAEFLGSLNELTKRGRGRGFVTDAEVLN